ncbi:hypothetical protein O181_042439 [Austropuccinia psidii MF-1]|uniref:RAVE complex protein Rav1 C-terminal domain-containing protein n=1 Tax=Austropuccinia psidii MF-1 TaxID=1389203 RepID=A0A9Q3DGF1_9BASI|nr:hypothetical protein [Austropuccinia psidii MF-1]
MIASTQDSSTKHLCACTKAARQAGPPTRLIAYAIKNTGTQSSNDLWPNRELTGALDLGLTTETSVETIKIQNLINLKGFEDHESPKTLRLLVWTLPRGWQLLDKNQDLELVPRQIQMNTQLFKSPIHLSISSNPFGPPTFLALSTDGQLSGGILHQVSPSVVFLEPHFSRFVPILCQLTESETYRAYRLVIIDLRQQPFTSGIFAMDNLQVKKSDYLSHGHPRLTWTSTQAPQPNLINECLLAVLCGNTTVSIYTREVDGWWNNMMNLKLKMGPISRISSTSRTTVPPWHPTVLTKTIIYGDIQIAISTLVCLSLDLKGRWQPLASLWKMLTCILDEAQCLNFSSKKNTASNELQNAKSHGVDLHGCRYLFSLLHFLDDPSQHKCSIGFDPTHNPGVLFAQLCTFQHLLAQETMSLLTSYSFQQTGVGPQLNWNTARVIGLFLWLNSKEDIQLHLEMVAQSEYVGGDYYIKNGASESKEHDPTSCSVFYMALGKKRLLLGLWKVAWKTAAQKNAFALISRQRFRFAASFFLLADRLQDAVNVCSHQLDDWQLGVAIARAYEGDQGPVLKKPINEVVLPLSFSNGNRWLMSWCFHIIGKTTLANLALRASFDALSAKANLEFSPAERIISQIGPLDFSLVTINSKSSSDVTWNQEKSFIILSVEELLNCGCYRLAWLITSR